MYSVSQASILQLCYIDPLIIDVALMSGNSCNKLRETLIHNDTFTHLGESGYQTQVDASSFPAQKKEMVIQLSVDKRSKENLFIIKTDLRSRIESCQDLLFLLSTFYSRE